MVTFNEAIQSGADQRSTLVDMINQFYSAPERMQEARSVIDAQADQAFDSVTGQFKGAQRQTAQGAARRGLQGSSIAASAQGTLQGQLNQAASGIEAQRQANTMQARLALQAQQNQALQQAYQQGPLQSQLLQSLNSKAGGQINQAQIAQQIQQQNQALQSQFAGQLGSAIASPINIYAALLDAQGG
jgi:hypothetical protein